MTARPTRARQARPAAAAPQVNDFDALINDFNNKESKDSLYVELQRRRFTPAERATISKAVVCKQNDKPAYCMLIYKAGGSKTISLVSPTCFNVQPGSQLNIKTLEYVLTSRDGKNYLNLDGEPL